MNDLIVNNNDSVFSNPSLIVKHNRLIECRGCLNEYESKLIAWCAAQINKSDSDFKEYVLTRKEAILLLGFADNISNKQINKILGNMYSKTIEIYDPERFGEEGWRRFSILDSDSFNSKTNIFKIKLSDPLKPYLLGLTSNFTKTELLHHLGLKGRHSNRFYDIITMELRGSSTANFYRDIDQLKETLGVHGKYNAFKDFNLRVIQPSIKQISKIAGLNISTTPSRFNSRSYKRIYFDVEMQDPRKSAYWRQMKSFGLKDNLIGDLTVSYGRVIIEQTLRKWGSQIGKGKFNNGTVIKNPSGFFLTKIKQFAEENGKQLMF